MRAHVEAFVLESNAIEGIHRAGTTAEVDAHLALFDLPTLEVATIEAFVWTVARARLRRHAGMDVQVGNHRPPPGGKVVEGDLRAFLEVVSAGEISPFVGHVRYETLHPFMDGNGRSGRAIWAWQMLRAGQDPFALPFLHRFYYQSLDGSRAER